MYRGIDDVMNALNPAFIENKVFAVPEVLEQKREERQTAKGGILIYSICRVKYTFFAEDGSSVQVITVGEGMDSGDKATNKAMAIAFKYACFQLFCIPTEEMVKEDARPVDPDGESHELVARGREEQKKKAENQLKKLTEAQINTLLNELARTGIGWRSVCANYKVEQLSHMNIEQFKDAMNTLRARPDKPVKEPEPETVPPEDMCGLPFN